MDTDLKTKIEQACDLIVRVLKQYERPAVLCSFGKDSVALLHLTRSMGLKLPVIFWREPHFPAKYAYANQLIEAWGLSVYDYPPHKSELQAHKGAVEVLNYYEIGGGESILLPTGVVEPEEGKEYLCGWRDLLCRPKGTMQFRWDVLLHGHKSSDVDPILGAVPLRVDVAVTKGAHAAYPLRHWTDADVWQYLEENQVPIHHERYERSEERGAGSEWRERADKTHNPDYFPACTACMMKGGPVSVKCPKMGIEVSNIAEQLPWVNPGKPKYVG